MEPPVRGTRSRDSSTSSRRSTNEQNVNTQTCRISLEAGSIDITQCLRRREGAHVSGITFHLHIPAVDNEEGCVGKCLEDLPRCKSVIYDSINRDCQLYSQKGTDPPAFLFPASSRIYYEFAWKQCLDSLLSTPAPARDTVRAHHVQDIQYSLRHRPTVPDEFKLAEPLTSHVEFPVVQQPIARPVQVHVDPFNTPIRSPTPTFIQPQTTPTPFKPVPIPIERISLNKFLSTNERAVDRGAPPCRSGEARIYLQFNSTRLVTATPAIHTLRQVSPDYCMRRCDNTQDCVGVVFEQSILRLGRCTLVSDASSLFERAPGTTITDNVFLLQICIPQSDWDMCNHDIFASYIGQLVRGDARKTVTEPSLQSCVRTCVHENDFHCLSASYVRDRRECRLNARRLSASISYGNDVYNQRGRDDNNIFYFENFCKAGRVLVERIAGEKPRPQELLLRYSRYRVPGKTPLTDAASSIVQEPSMSNSGGKIEISTLSAVSATNGSQRQYDNSDYDAFDYGSYFYGPHKLSVNQQDDSSEADNLETAPRRSAVLNHPQRQRAPSYSAAIPHNYRPRNQGQRLQKTSGVGTNSWVARQKPNGNAAAARTRQAPPAVQGVKGEAEQRSPPAPGAGLTQWTDWSECEEVEGRRAKLRIRTCVDETFKCPGQKVDVWSCDY